MEQIKFGNGRFEIYPVINLLKENEASYKLLFDAWVEFGYNLGLSDDEMKNLREKIGSGEGESQIKNIPRDILRVWRKVHHESANLDVLLEALIDIDLEELADAVRQKFGGNQDEIVAPPPRKKLRQMDPENSQEEVEVETVTIDDDEDDDDNNGLNVSNKDGSTPLLRTRENSQDEVEVETVTIDDHEVDDGNNGLNVPDKDGYTAPLRAIRNGQSVDCIEKMLNEGANVNMKTRNDKKENAAHVVIGSLIKKTLEPKTALSILNHVVLKEFNLINEQDFMGFTPLLYAMQFDGLDEELLEWFSKNGADFNAVVEGNGYSVLLQAIFNRKNAKIIRKILELGANPKHIGKYRDNALHVSARYANESAMEIFVDQFDINEGNVCNNTPLHLLFVENDLDYRNCLSLLCKKKANFGLENIYGHVPLVHWMMYAKDEERRVNPFSTLIKLKDQLPVTEDISSATLTVIVEQIDLLKRFLPYFWKQKQNAFVQFIVYLIKEKNGKVLLEDEKRWKKGSWCWDRIGKTFLKGYFFRELRKSRVNWKGKLREVGAGNLGKLELRSTSSSVTVPIETFLVCLLASRNYKAFKEVCQFLKIFCQSLVREADKND